MFWLKACPRCRGDIYVDRDSYGPFLHCLQCGYIKDLDENPKIRVQVSKSEVKRKGRKVASR